MHKGRTKSFTIGEPSLTPFLLLVQRGMPGRISITDYAYPFYNPSIAFLHVHRHARRHHEMSHRHHEKTHRHHEMTHRVEPRILAEMPHHVEPRIPVGL